MAVKQMVVVAIKIPLTRYPYRVVQVVLVVMTKEVLAVVPQDQIQHR